VVCRSICLSVTLVSPAKVAEPIEMPFGLRTWLGPRDHALDGGSDPPMGRGKFLEENGRPIVKYRDILHSSTVVCGKMAELMEMPFGLWARMGPRNPVLHGGPDPPWEGAILGGKGRPL